MGAHRLCRPPPLAAFHHACVLTDPPAAARVAHETTTLRATSRHGPSVLPPWPASGAATVWRSPSHGSVGAVATARVSSYGQKTRNRLDSRVYEPAMAQTSACLLPIPSCILNAK